MADAKISQLPALTEASLDDVLAIVDDPTGSAVTKQITIANLLSSTPPFESIDVTGTSQAMAVNKAYVANNAAEVTLTLPAAASFGDMIIIVGKGAGGWKVAQNASQTIYFGKVATTTGITGEITSDHQRDTMALMCVTANNDWQSIYSIGESIVVT